MAANQQAKRKAILEALGKGHTRKAAAQYARCHIDTFHEWLKDPNFSEAVLKAEADAHMECIDIVRAAAPTSWQAAAWLAERHPQWKREWKRPDELDPRKLSTEQILALIEELERRAESSGDRAAVEAAERERLER